MGKSSKLTFWGAARGVTGSCFHLEVDGAAIIVDCGVFQGERDADDRNRAAFGFEPGALVGAVLTHGHLDHVGRLPLLGRSFTAPVIGHAATLEIAKVILADSAKVAIHSGREPLYGRDAVDAVTEQMQAIAGYGQTTSLGPFSISMFDAGHILGSSSVRVAWTSGGSERAILFSGDLGRVGTPILHDPFRAWRPEQAVDAIVVESTYGDRLHPDRASVRESFRQIIQRALDDGGKVLIPAFSIGRTQEVLYELNTLVESGQLRGIPVIVDGPLGLSATRIYDKYRGVYDDEALALLARGDEPLEFDHLFSSETPKHSRAAVDLDGPAIVIAGAGMCQGGRIRRHLKAHLPDRRTDLILVGYQARGTLGRALQEGRNEVWIDGDHVPVRARVSTLSGLSAHADRDGLVGWAEAVPRRDGCRMLVNHGEEEVAMGFAALLGDKLGVTAEAPALGQTVELPG